MRNVIVVLALLFGLFAGCSENNSAKIWTWGDSRAVGARIGTNITENNEAGLSMLWWPSDSEPRVLGLYGVHHFPEPIVFRNPLILDFLPKELKAKSYLGGKLDVTFDTDDVSIDPVAGIVFEDIFFLEYQLQSFSQDSSSMISKILFGLRMEF